MLKNKLLPPLLLAPPPIVRAMPRPATLDARPTIGASNSDCNDIASHEALALDRMAGLARRFTADPAKPDSS
jgi:hypothetical protein